MVSAALILSVAVQQVSIEASVDREQVTVGDEVVLTVVARGPASEPLAISDPALRGLDLRETSEFAQSSVQTGTHTRTRTFHLAATQVGIAVIGQIGVAFGDSTVFARPIEVSVAARGVGAGTLQQQIREMVEARSPPQLSADDVFVEVMASRDSILLGEQIDLAVVAWFPRDIRQRLRNPPLLQPAQLSGVWTYPQDGPGTVALSRRINDVVFDLYLHHQVVFPLTPGDFVIGPATVSYSLPLTYSFLSRELRHEVTSDSVRIVVAPQPAIGRPAGFDGASGRSMSLRLSASRSEIAEGDAGEVVATLSGIGNVALWPEPHIQWPAGLRVYPERVEVDAQPGGGQVGGVKRFHYLVVADSAGLHRVPASSYEYFDTDAKQFRSATTEALELVARVSGARRPVEAATVSLLGSGRPIGGWADHIPFWGWLLVGLAPPGFVLLRLLVKRRRRRRPPRDRRPVTGLDELELEFRRALAVLVPTPEALDSERVASALRASGVEEPVAQHVARVRGRLWHAKYGPQGEVDSEELQAEVREVLRALTGSSEPHERAQIVSTAALALIVFATPLYAQSAERLYDAGAYLAAADSFRARAERDAGLAANWHNLAAAHFHAGEPAKARAAWARARRLAPRDNTIDAAAADLPVLDATSARLLWTSKLTASEALLLAGGLWIAGWLAATAYRRRWLSRVCISAAIVLAAYGAFVVREYARPIAVVLDHETPLRLAPYGTAHAASSLADGSLVVIDHTEGAWALVRHGTQRGWVLRSEIEPL